jgi:hypothetical protein
MFLLRVQPGTGIIYALTIDKNKPDNHVRRDGTTFGRNLTKSRPSSTEVSPRAHRGLATPDARVERAQVCE